MSPAKAFNNDDALVAQDSFATNLGVFVETYLLEITITALPLLVDSYDSYVTRDKKKACWYLPKGFLGNFASSTKLPKIVEAGAENVPMHKHEVRQSRSNWSISRSCSDKPFASLENAVMGSIRGLRIARTQSKSLLCIVFVGSRRREKTLIHPQLQNKRCFILVIHRSSNTLE